MSAAPKLEDLTQGFDFKKKETRKELTDKIATYFSRVSNNDELFKIGKKFMEEFKAGVKNFAITSTGYKNSQQRTILAIVCYFDYADQYRIAVISDQLKNGVFDELVKDSTEKNYQLNHFGDHVNYRSFQHHVDFIDYAELLRIYDEHMYSKTFDFEVKSILDKYDIVFWDVPELDKMKMNLQFNYRLSHFYDSLTMIVSPTASSGKKVEKVKKFFNNFNINLTGILLETSSAIEQPKRKKFLGVF